MRKKLLRISYCVFIIPFFIINFNNLCAQENYKQSSQEIIKLINESQNFYSIDDEIVNGFVYPVPNSKIQGDPYLRDQWTDATVFVNNKEYTNLLVKYDLIIDRVILKAEIENGFQRLVELNNFQIDSFLVGNSLFVNSQCILNDENNQTYYEQIFKGEYSLYKDYKKIFIKEYNLNPYGKYSDLSFKILLFNKNKLININKSSAFIKCFKKEKQSDIKSYLKKNKIKFKDASPKELKQLMEFCTTIISN